MLSKGFRDVIVFFLRLGTRELRGPLYGNSRTDFVGLNYLWRLSSLGAGEGRCCSPKSVGVGVSPTTTTTTTRIIKTVDASCEGRCCWQRSLNFGCRYSDLRLFKHYFQVFKAQISNEILKISNNIIIVIKLESLYTKSRLHIFLNMVFKPHVKKK